MTCKSLRFEAFTLDLERLCLDGPPGQIDLRRKSFDVLRYLVEHAERVVTKEELIKAVWPDVTVGDESLTQCISEVRRALGEQSHRIIKTVPRRGYLFNVPISRSGTIEGQNPNDAKSPVEALSLALPLPDRASIAILPFTNLSPDPDQDYFADGMVEDIITALSRFKALFVIARNSSFTYKGRAVDVKQIGRELGVQVTESVVGAIAPAVEKAEIERAKRKPTESLDAYTLYLRGSARLHQIENRRAHDEALQLFHRAIELDPEFASAYGRAAFCYIPAQGNSWISVTANEIAEVTRLAQRAVELGKDDAIALAHSGYALAYVARDLGLGAALIDRALVLNSNLAEAWSFGGWVKIFLGEPEAAIERFARAMRLSPLDPFVTGMRTGTSYAHFLLGRFDEAVLWAAMALQDKPDFQPGLRIAAASNAMAGRPEQAHKAMARLRQLNPALRVSNLKDVLSPYRRAEDLSRYQEGLRQAGLPE